MHKNQKLLRLEKQKITRQQIEGQGFEKNSDKD